MAGFILLPFGLFYWFAPFIGKWDLGNDYVSAAISHQMELQYSLRHGTFPLYVPGFAGGRSAAALTQGQIYHPISHLAALSPGYWKGYALEWNSFYRLLSLGFAHLFLFLLLRKLGLSNLWSLIISMITVYNLRMLDTFRYGSSMENYTGYLFLCTAMAFYYLKPSRRIGPLSMIASAYLLIVGGHAQIMYYGLLGAALAALALPFVMDAVTGADRTDYRRKIRFWGVVGICVFAALVIASPYILSFYFEFVRDNAIRVGRDYAWSEGYSDSLGGALNSFFDPLRADVHGAFGSTSLVVLIAVLPVLPLFRKKMPPVVFVLWCALVMIFATSLGNDTPLHFWFWKYFPFAQTFRVPGRILTLFPFLFLLLLAWIFHPEPGRLYRAGNRTRLPHYLPLSVVGSVLFGIYHLSPFGILSGPSFFIPANITDIPPAIDTVVLWTGAATLLFTVGHGLAEMKSRPAAKAVFAALIVVFVIVQLVCELRYGTWIERKKPAVTLEELDLYKKKSMGFYGLTGLGYESPAITSQMEHSILEPETAKFYRSWYSVGDRAEAYRILSLKNVTRTLAVENPDRPSGIRTIDSETENLAEIDSVRLEKRTNNLMSFAVDARRPGYAAFAIPFSNRWKAFSDGRQKRLYRANGYLTAVYLEAGKHRVELRYTSAPTMIGMAAGVSGLFLICLYVALTMKRNDLRAAIVISSIFFLASGFWIWNNSLYHGRNLGPHYQWTSQDFPDAANVAYAKKTSMSSVYSHAMPHYFYSGLGVDGDRSGDGFLTESEKEPWWQVDLGRKTTVAEIRIYDPEKNGEAHLPLSVLISDDGREFVPAALIEERGPENPWRIPLARVEGRFVRLRSGSRGEFSFPEIEIYSKPAP